MWFMDFCHVLTNITEYTEKVTKIMQFGTIASGSSGNCIYVGDRDTHILVDAGVSAKRICAGLAQYGLKPQDLDAVIVTHEHSDHIAGLGVMLRKYHIPVYSTRGTIWGIKAAKTLGAMPEECFHEIRPENDFKIGDLTIEPFRISHDAYEPVSYALHDEESRVGMVTDLGYYDEHIVDHLKDADLLYIEANHDVHMLQVGPYPYYLKQRILGNKGHLSNEAAGRLINELMNDHLKKVILGHLSKENNYPELALESVRLEMGLAGIHQMSLFEPVNDAGFDRDDVAVAPRDAASALINL